MNEHPLSPVNCRPSAGSSQRWLFRAVALVVLTFAVGTLPASADESTTTSDANEVFHCTFDEAWDANFDGWPDRWVRKSGIEFPNYVEIKIRDTAEAKAINPRWLQIDLDAASALVSSPPIRVMSRFSYRLEARLWTSGLKNSDATLLVDFFDAAGNVLQTERVPLDSRADGWHTLRLANIDPQSDKIDRATITLEVQRVGPGDLKGRICLNDVWLARLPRITVTTNNPYNVYRNLGDVLVRCELSGIRERDPEIRFQLLNAERKELSAGTVRLDGRLIVEDEKTASDVVDGVGNTPAGYEGTTEWRPQIPSHGFYSVVVRMLKSDVTGKLTDDEREMDRRVIWVAVVPPLPMPPKGDFGWTLPVVNHPLSFQDMSGLLSNVGINWVKVPAWYSAAKPQCGDELIRFVEMLSASNIEVVGMLDHPPADSEIALRAGPNASIADILSGDPAQWMPSLEPVMSRLTMRLRCWQLGGDSDTGSIGFPNLAKRWDQLRGQLFRFGQQVQMGLPWVWDSPPLAANESPWDFEQLSAASDVSLADFEKLVSSPRHNAVRRWVTIDPPPQPDEDSCSSSDLDSRATQLVRKMVLAKEHGVDGIFISNPFNNHNGLMHANGMPAELLLPWRTTAAMLGGAKYIGTVQLPGGSENLNFIRPDGQVVMVVWNGEPTQEKLFLGSGARQINVWGDTTPLPLNEYEQTMDVGPLPSFVLGVSEPVARWRMAMSFENDRIPSIFSAPHPNSIKFQNFFPQGVGGTIAIVARPTHANRSDETEPDVEEQKIQPDRWTIDPPRGSFGVAAGESARFPFEIRLKNAIFGEQPMQVNFVVDADESYHFSVYRTMWVGTGDITLEMKCHLDKDGTLIVEQFMTNKAADPIDLKCFLRAEGYRRQRAQVYRLGPTPYRTVYRYPGGKELVGKELLLEAEQVNGELLVKYPFTVVDDQSRAEPETPNAVANVESPN